MAENSLTQNDPTRKGGTPLTDAFRKAFIVKPETKPITDPAAALALAVELLAAGEPDAAGLAIGDCIVNLDPVDRNVTLDLLAWLVANPVRGGAR